MSELLGVFEFDDTPYKNENIGLCICFGMFPLILTVLTRVTRDLGTPY